MPNSYEAEATLLGNCINDPETMDLADQLGIDAECFWNPVTRMAWGLFKELNDAHRPADLAMLFEAIKAKGLTESLPIATLLQFTDMNRITHRARFFAQRLLELRQLREIMRATGKVQESVKSYAGDAAAMRGTLEQCQTVLSGFTLRENNERLKEVVTRVKQGYEDQRAGKPPPGQNIGTGLPVADLKLQLLNSKRDYYNVIAARPSCGKTSLATQIMQSCLATVPDSVVVDFQLENSRDNHVAQMASRFAQVDLYKPKEWDETQVRNFNAYLDRMAAVADSRLYVFESDNAIEQIKSRLRQLKAKHGTITLVVIDYLQLLTTWQPIKDERKALNYISRELKLLAKEIGCPFLILAQLSRGFEAENREPQLRDLKESGNIEADADRVWMLHKPEGAKLANGVIPIDLFQRKNKYGPVGRVPLSFKPMTTTFYDRQSGED